MYTVLPIVALASMTGMAIASPAYAQSFETKKPRVHEAISQSTTEARRNLITQCVRRSLGKGDPNISSNTPLPLHDIRFDGDFGSVTQAGKLSITVSRLKPACEEVIVGRRVQLNLAVYQTADYMPKSVLEQGGRSEILYTGMNRLPGLRRVKNSYIKLREPLFDTDDLVRSSYRLQVDYRDARGHVRHKTECGITDFMNRGAGRFVSRDSAVGCAMLRLVSPPDFVPSPAPDLPNLTPDYDYPV